MKATLTTQESDYHNRKRLKVTSELGGFAFIHSAEPFHWAGPCLVQSSDAKGKEISALRTIRSGKEQKH